MDWNTRDCRVMLPLQMALQGSRFMLSTQQLSYATACFALIVQSVPSAAYNISKKGTVHESLTRLAEMCLEKAGGQMPARCDQNAVAGARKVKDWRTETSMAVRWPDDPTQQLSGLSAVKFVFNAGGLCKNWFDRAEPAEGDPYSGLLCSSHYGPLQFMHAMRSSDGETAAQTRAKILDWVDVAYRVATGRVSRSEGYCGFLRGRPAIGSALVPPNFPWCEAPGAAAAGKEYDGWRVHTLFSMRCSNPLQSRTCDEFTHDAGEEMARRNAKGALLHLVQDSFSQSHVQRGPAQTGRKLKAKIVCAPAQQFHFYNGQKANGINHGSADKFPLLDGTSCSGSAGVYDPVTASAIILWHVWKNSDPAAVVEYVDKHVLGSEV